LGFGVWDFGFPVLQSRAPDASGIAGPDGGFGLLTKISTPVENTVEKRAIQSEVAQKTRFLASFLGAKAPGRAGLRHTSRVVV